MKILITSIISIAIGIAIGLFLSPKPRSSTKSVTNAPNEQNQNLASSNAKLIVGRWFCNSTSGWTGVYELLPDGIMKGYPTKGGSVTGSWTIQTSLRLHHPNGGQDNFDLPNPDGVILGVSNAGNKLSMIKVESQSEQAAPSNR